MKTNLYYELYVHFTNKLLILKHNCYHLNYDLCSFAMLVFFNLAMEQNLCFYMFCFQYILLITYRLVTFVISKYTQNHTLLQFIYSNEITVFKFKKHAF